MNPYEARIQQNIQRNNALLAGLDIKPLSGLDSSAATARSGAKRSSSNKQLPVNKKRKHIADAARPARTSARLASAGLPRKNYNDDDDDRKPKASRGRRLGTSKHNSQPEPDPPVAASSPSPPSRALDPESIQARWTAWTPSAPPPSRHPSTAVFHFPDFPAFTPNLSPEEMLRQGSFGGSYFRPLRSRTLGIVVADDWTELPRAWTEGLNVSAYLTSPRYDPDVNKFHVACGQSIEEWEAAGWIAHEFDVRGWFQWYTRFWRGRRCEDDVRQVARWKKCVGPTGRWRRMLLKKYLQMGVRTVWDDGEDGEETVEVSPVMHQTCHHWAFEVRQEHLDRAWAGDLG